jgi:predicted amidophosphoribosyltransferase
MTQMRETPTGCKVLCDLSYGKIGTCKDCGTQANLDKGLCEECFMNKYTPKRVTL